MPEQARREPAKRIVVLANQTMAEDELHDALERIEGSDRREVPRGGSRQPGRHRAGRPGGRGLRVAGDHRGRPGAARPDPGGAARRVGSPSRASSATTARCVALDKAMQRVRARPRRDLDAARGALDLAAPRVVADARERYDVPIQHVVVHAPVQVPRTSSRAQAQEYPAIERIRRRVLRLRIRLGDRAARPVACAAPGAGRSRRGRRVRSDGRGRHGALGGREARPASTHELTVPDRSTQGSVATNGRRAFTRRRARETSVAFTSAMTLLPAARSRSSAASRVIEDVDLGPSSSWIRTTAMASPRVIESTVPGSWLRVENFMEVPF